MNGVVQTLERKVAPAQAKPRRHTVMRTAVETLSRRNFAAAKAELLNEVIHRLTALCYEIDDSRQLCNVDATTGRILIPMPTSRPGRPRWGLYRSEGDTLRRILFAWQGSDTRPPLFVYDPTDRRWYVNLHDYPTLDAAQFWLGRNPITAALFAQKSG